MASETKYGVLVCKACHSRVFQVKAMQGRDVRLAVLVCNGCGIRYDVQGTVIPPGDFTLKVE